MSAIIVLLTIFESNCIFFTNMSLYSSDFIRHIRPSLKILFENHSKQWDCGLLLIIMLWMA